MWLDDIKTWTNPDWYEAIKRTAEDDICGDAAHEQHVYLLKQKKTADDDDYTFLSTPGYQFLFSYLKF